MVIEKRNTDYDNTYNIPKQSLKKKIRKYPMTFADDSIIDLQFFFIFLEFKVMFPPFVLPSKQHLCWINDVTLSA